MKFPNLTLCILDAFTTDQGELSWSTLESLGALTVYERTAPGEVLERARDHQILITNKVVISREILSELPECRLVCLLSTGTNVVDLEACRERGIPVCNIPAYSSDSVAELVFALLLEWARGVGEHARAVRQGGWTGHRDFCFLRSPQTELRGRTLGLLGFGDIAQAVTRIAVGFGMRVVSHTPHPEGKPALGQTFVDFETLLESSDVLSLHCPLTPDTDRLIGSDVLERMKSGAVLINTGRGGLLDESAVAEALRAGKLSAALLDVLSTEPPRPENPLLDAPNCFVTPHIAWATAEARSRLIEILCGNVKAWLDGKPRNVVNGL